MMRKAIIAALVGIGMAALWGLISGLILSYLLYLLVLAAAGRL